ncbi:MAG: NADH-quinone oxidoreductase subunit NuoN [Actinomycetota bacterium]|jgi:NADH-quinone oxidoreductase subunit N
MSTVVIAAGLEAPSLEWGDLAPLLVLLAGACSLLLLGSLVRGWTQRLGTALTTAVALTSGAWWAIVWERDSTVVGRFIIADALTIDRATALTGMVVAAAAAAASLLLHSRPQNGEGTEVNALLLTSAIGAVVLAGANDLVSLFLGLEILSLSLYLLAASNRRRDASQEAGFKYFVLGGVASAFMLYGIALVYGATTSTSLDVIRTGLEAQARVSGSDALLLVGIGLLLVGLAFKVSAVPFQIWTPDVYEGAPTAVTAYMASAGKVAAFVALSRVIVDTFGRRVDDWRPALWALAILSTVVGSVMAISQTNVKRLLAYSSISHAGFVLVGLEAAGARDTQGVPASMAYLVAYAVMVLGSFASVVAVTGRDDGDASLESFRGLARRHPQLALAFSVLLLAQAGVPLTSGFVVKFGVISAAVDAGSNVLAVVAMVAAVIAAFLYLKIMVSMWLEDPADAGCPVVPAPVAVVIAVAVGFTLLVGFLPGWLVNATSSIGG